MFLLSFVFDLFLSHNSFRELLFVAIFFSNPNTFFSVWLVCQMVQHGVAAIVGPTDPSVAAHVQSMAEILKVPHIETRLETKLLTRFHIKLLIHRN